ncbi:hypothetical protein [Litorisediminicola beolgyonensis]|uniref:Uncharacterized protein n=1 Tax=Litorisediminicola beolgyonensis TaxID=1173614 RepID=A0ABW3ZGT8_9RHOB
MDRLAYLFDEDELLELMPEWPPGLRVALCMGRSGATRPVFIKADQDIPERIAEAMGWEQGAFAISPAIDGCPSVRVMFSEAQTFTRILLSEGDLLQRAERVLNPNAAAPEIELPKVRVAEAGRVRALDEHRALPEGFHDPGSFDEDDTALLPAEIRVAGARVRIAICPDRIERTALPQRIEAIGLRDDLRCFVIPRDALEPWDSSRGCLIDVPMSAFPRALSGKFLETAHRAEVGISPWGIFVTPLDPVGTLSTPKRNGRHPVIAKVGGLRTLLVGMAALGLVSASVVTAVQPTGPEPEDRLAYKPAPGNSALNVLESFAASDARLSEDDLR